MSRKLLLVPFMFTSLLSLGSEAALRTRAHYVMGTIFEISAYGQDAESTVAAIEEAFGEIRRLDKIMSNYREDSDLTALNKNAAADYLPVCAELYAVLRASVKYAELTQGAFDVTVAPLVKAWGFFSGKGRVPSELQIKSILAKVGYRHLQFDDKRRAVKFGSPGVEVDLGGIGKGWAVDRAAEILRRRGIRSALISAGTSTIYALGATPEGGAWIIGVRHPLKENEIIARVALRDESLSTSGSYEKFFKINGKRYCHILDPLTGRPVDGMLSVTVIAPTATESDALSTAVFVMGAEKGQAFMRGHKLSGILIAGGDKREMVIKVVRSPSDGKIILSGENR